MPIANFTIRSVKQIEITLVAALVCFLTSCTELRSPEPNPYLAETQPPAVQQFRWSNGGKPKSLDPAKASSAPETDLARSMYEGLTVIDPGSLEAVPGAAEKWVSSEDGLSWTFIIREDARWSNGRRVTADDFVRSWQRLFDMGEAAAHRNLLHNFAARSESTTVEMVPDAEAADFVESEDSADAPDSEVADETVEPEKVKPEGNRLEISAPDEQTLIVKLKHPDKDFPKLLAHPVFMPVFGTGFALGKLTTKVVSNGPFRITEIDAGGISLERSKTYWNRENVKIEKLQFVPLAKADEALEAYRTGKIDALTNTEISPLAQRVFSTAADFRKNTFAALNFYEINSQKPPYNDRRVREALAVAIDRERLITAENETTIQPAFSFLPFAIGSQKKLVQDKDHARELLEQSGFPDGRGFPTIKLTVNRNETQLRVARAVAKMWKDNLNIDTELVVKENQEIAKLREIKDFDIIRRGVVLPVPDEIASMTAIGGSYTNSSPDQEPGRRAANQGNSNSDSNSSNVNSLPLGEQVGETRQILTESEALYQMHAIPLYFPISFALVKPYVSGFEMNSLDTPNLTETAIDTAWQPRER